MMDRVLILSVEFQGIMSIEEALDIKMAGASALYVRHEVWQGSGELKGEDFIRRLRDELSSNQDFLI